MSVQKKQGVLSLETQDVLRSSNKLLSIQLEAIAKKLEAVQEVANISSNGEVYDFMWKSSWKGCMPSSKFWISEEQVKYMGAYTRQKQNPYSNNYITAGQIKKYHWVETIASNHHKQPINNHKRKILKKFYTCIWSSMNIVYTISSRYISLYIFLMKNNQ